ncbi:putative pectinesterase/pectinesterase inhibitor 45 [Senna tora]|uniref:Putative pectinesterase/pectinesterase inhibitor 45 n=1 Tax=Senna tora TaxID=362788 RepID=A0A834TBC0_9FABA|nr:putative pectinesterase/pectinesterase inhibitor 45 [Senna tora]KAF7818082.1 putative pectinesterase/pectinesterase inhibitor 45 [Senna tora]
MDEAWDKGGSVGSNNIRGQLSSSKGGVKRNAGLNQPGLSLVFKQMISSETSSRSLGKQATTPLDPPISNSTSQVRGEDVLVKPRLCHDVTVLNDNSGPGVLTMILDFWIKHLEDPKMKSTVPLISHSRYKCMPEWAYKVSCLHGEVLIPGHNGLCWAITVDQNIRLLSINQNSLPINASLDVDNESALMILWVGIKSCVNGFELTTSILGNHNIGSRRRDDEAGFVVKSKLNAESSWSNLSTTSSATASSSAIFTPSSFPFLCSTANLSVMLNVFITKLIAFSTVAFMYSFGSSLFTDPRVSSQYFCCCDPLHITIAALLWELN